MSTPVLPHSSAVLRPRHRLSVRIAHWVNAFSFFAMVVSGFFILLAHPRLYWGETGYFGDPAVIDFPLPLIKDYSGWARSLHFLGAWILVINGALYLLSGLVGGHFFRRMLPSRLQLRVDHIVQDLREHLRFKAPTGGQGYNLLQKLAYLVVIFVLFPVVVLTGLTMSPAVTAAWPWLFDLFAGRQSARTIHFFAASGLVLFLLVHVFQVILVGFRKEVWAMIAGGRQTTHETHPDSEAAR